MKYKDRGFRALYKNICIYPMNDTFSKLLEDQKGYTEAEGVMVYGYVDHEKGNMLECLAFTKQEDAEKYSFVKFNDDIRLNIKVSEVIDEEFSFIDYGKSHFYDKFKKKIDKLTVYDINDDILKSRALTFLDPFRHEDNFDDLKVILFKDECKLEGVWVKLEVLGKGAFMGTLLNEPTQDFGIHNGSPVSFFLNESTDKSRQLVASVKPSKKIKEKDLADGKLLKEAISAFNADKEEKDKFKLYEVLEILRDSTVVVPYTKKGLKTITANKSTFFPVFSNVEEMPKNDKSVIKTKMTFLEAIARAKLGTPKVEGIVVNGFTESFFVPNAMFGLIEEIESRL